MEMTATNSRAAEARRQGDEMKASKYVLIVDDEQDIRELIDYNLDKEGYETKAVATGEEALREIRARTPDLVVLDLMLPGVDGLEVCRRLKKDPTTAAVPIVMLTARGEDADVVKGLELGAVDYVIKPFSPKVLSARVKAQLRRAEDDGPADTDDMVIERGPVTIDMSRHRVTVEGEPIAVTALEMRILLTLARRPGLVFTRYQIVDQTQGEGVGVTDRSVDVHIVALRRKLGNHGTLIETVRGVGYRFKEV